MNDHYLRFTVARIAVLLCLCWLPGNMYQHSSLGYQAVCEAVKQSSSPAEGGHELVSDSGQAELMVRRIARRFMDRGQVWGNYTLDLTLEAMLDVDAALGVRTYLPYVQSIMQKRNRPPDAVIPYESQPFCHINYKLYKVTGDRRYVEPFLAETQRYRRQVGRSPEGAITHKPDQPGRHLLIDMLQDYASRMAQAGELSGDESYFAECVEQYRIYRRLLRDPNTGLWSQGRGWFDEPMALSPGAWSRGHGWLIRGMVESLCSLPKDSSYYVEMQRYLRELADALLRVQDANGMWHQLLHLPFDRSYPESSGTGLICYNLAKAFHEGLLTDAGYRIAALRAFEGLREYITDDGAVLGACEGPGLLRSVAKYWNTPAKPDDSHGPPALLFACAGRILLEKSPVRDNNPSVNGR